MGESERGAWVTRGAGAGSAVSVPSMVRAVGLVVAALLLGSCGGTDSADLPSPTSTRSIPSPTATLPDPTRSPDREDTAATSEPTRTTRSPGRSEDPSPTETEAEPGPTRSSEAPEPSPTRSVPVAAPSPTQPAPEPTITETRIRTETISPTEEESTAAPSPTTSPSVQPTSAESDSAPTWLWWLLGAVVLALAVGIPLLIRARRRAEWRTDLASAEDEVAWFARVLIPELRGQSSLAEASGGWNVAESRVAAVEDRLTALEPLAPDEAAQLRAVDLRDAVRAARGQIRDLLESGRPETMSQGFDVVAAQLEQVLGASTPTSVTATRQVRRGPR